MFASQYRLLREIPSDNGPLCSVVLVYFLLSQSFQSLFTEQFYVCLRNGQTLVEVAEGYAITLVLILNFYPSASRLLSFED